MMYFVVTAILAIGFFSATAAAQPRDSSVAYDRSSDPHGFVVFMRESGWCWFQDPRAILPDNKLLIGSVQGNGSGPAVVGVYDLSDSKPLGRIVMHDHFDRDDHNAPVFYERPDGSVLAMYARHGRDKLHHYRISNPDNLLEWGPERVIDHSDTLPARDRVTYMNLIHLSDQGKLYNFYRGFEFNPSFVTSTDHGLTWGEDTHFIKSEVGGYQRPYARYAGDGKDTVHVSFTDAHPHEFGNSIYYIAFRDQKFFRADGTQIKDLRQDGPLRPSESEQVYRGSGKIAPSGRASAVNSAWTASIAIDHQGYPHIGYTVHFSSADHRFRIASWDGSRWRDREVAFAGRRLYDRETSYTGLITLDPKDPSVVVISSDVDPATGTFDGGFHEIYRANTELADDVKTIQWTAVTTDSPVRNLRPIIVRNDKSRIILWNRGIFETFSDYQLDAVGLVEPLTVEPGTVEPLTVEPGTVDP